MLAMSAIVIGRLAFCQPLKKVLCEIADAERRCAVQVES